MRFGLKKIVIAGIICCAAIGSVAGVSAAVRKATVSNQPVMVVQASELNQEWFDTENPDSEGELTRDVKQNEYIKDNLEVKKLYVEEGQSVKKGDVLFEYDTEKTALELTREELNLKTLERDLENARERMEKLNKMQPTSGSSIDADDVDDDDEFDDVEEDDISEEDEDPVDNEDISEGPEYGKIIIYTQLDQTSVPFYDRAKGAAKAGSEENPYRFLCASRSSITVKKEFVHLLKSMEGDGYFQIEIREGDTVSGRLLRAWKQNAADINVSDTWEGVFDGNDSTPVIPMLDTTDAQQTDEEKEQLKTDLEKLRKEIEEKEKIITQLEEKDLTDDMIKLEEERDALAERAGALEGDNETLKASVEALQKEIDELKEQLAAAAPIAGEPSDADLTSSARAIRPVAYLAVMRTTPKAVFTAYEDDDGDDEEAERDTKRNYLKDEEDDLKDAEFTKEELEKEQEDQSASIKQIELDIKEVKLKIKDLKKAMDEQQVKAKVDGTITVAGGNSENGPYVQVSGSGGYAVKGYIPENMLDKIHTGDKVLASSWMSGESVTATITEISEYPSSGSMFWGGNANESSYPFTAVIDEEDVPFTEDDTILSISFDKNVVSEQSDGLYIEQAFVMKTGNDAYVYIKGENDLIEIWKVKLGKKTSRSYEIKSGITSEDYLAFPYWKNTKVGAKTYEGSYEELQEK